MIESAQHHPALQNPVKAAEGWKGQKLWTSCKSEWQKKKTGIPIKRFFWIFWELQLGS